MSSLWPSLPGRRSSCSPWAKWHLWPNEQWPCSVIPTFSYHLMDDGQHSMLQAHMQMSFSSIIGTGLCLVEALPLLSQDLRVCTTRSSQLASHCIALLALCPPWRTKATCSSCRDPPLAGSPGESRNRSFKSTKKVSVTRRLGHRTVRLTRMLKLPSS